MPIGIQFEMKTPHVYRNCHTFSWRDPHFPH